jgi:hypothetical protein
MNLVRRLGYLAVLPLVAGGSVGNGATTTKKVRLR